jgi:hypothetical protein
MTHVFGNGGWSDTSFPFPFVSRVRLASVLVARVTRPDEEDSADDAADDEALGSGAADSSVRAFSLSSSRSLAALTRALERTGFLAGVEDVGGCTDCAEGVETCSNEDEVLAVASGCSVCRLSI